MSEEKNIHEEESTDDCLQPSEKNNAEEKTITEPQIEISKSQTPENMEVHHHGHVHEKKKWKEYVFQFLMLFLAITLGFFVENRREHYIEGVRAEEYAHTLLQDIIKDTIELDRTISIYIKDLSTLDTLIELDNALKTGTPPSGAIYYYGNAALTAFRVGFNDATLQQLKNSGNLRYFRNVSLKEKISAYDNAIRTFSLRQDFELTFVPEINFYSRMFDHVVKNKLFINRHRVSFIDSFVKANPPLLINNPVVIKQFLGFCYVRRNNWRGRIQRNIVPVLVLARELIVELKKEYNLK